MSHERPRWPKGLKPRIILTFRHYKGGRSSAKRSGRFYPRRNPWYSLSEAESTSGHMVLSGVPRKKFPVTPPGIDSGTVRLVAQCLNHYATAGPIYIYIYIPSSDTMIGGWQMGRATEESDRGINWGAVPQGCTLGGAATPLPTNWKLKKQRFCRHDDIKRFAWFTLQPKSGTQISWWLVH